jgi:glycosyltransferase involved in cell wall biosynthesis
MKHFLADNRILWVNTIGMRRPKLNLYDAKRGWGKIISWLSRKKGKLNEKNPTVLSPFMIPYNTPPFIRSFNRFSVIRNVREEMKRLSFKNPIVITTLPNAADYLGAFGESLDVYYCVDEFSEWPGVERLMVKEMEDILITKVHFMVAVSEELKKNKKSPTGPTYLLTHGVDVEHFSNPTPCNKYARVDIMGGIQKPIIGYFGLFDERSDLNILQNILRRHPEWSLVIIGKSMIDTQTLQRHKNFYHINAVPYSDLPLYASYFNVCIIPYVRNILTNNINPLKLKEYLATGKPVVSTALPEAVKLKDLISIAYDIDEFLICIEKSLIKNKVATDMQIKAVKTEDWYYKAEQLSSWIEDALK